MSATKVKSGPFGTFNSGFDGVKPDPDEVERNERRVFKPVDVTDVTLKEFLGDIGPAILSKQFEIVNPGLRSQDITFDRFYQKIGLLVHNFSTRIDYRTQKSDVELAADIARMTEFADKNKFSFLPIIDGKCEIEDMQRLKGDISARANNAA